MMSDVVAAHDAFAQLIMDTKPLPELHRLLTEQPARGNNAKDVSCIIANLADIGTHIQALMDANLFRPLVAILRQDKDDATAMNAAVALSNAVVNATSRQIRFLVEHGFIPALCHLFVHPNAKMVVQGLDAMDCILRTGRKQKAFNPYVHAVEVCNGLDSLEQLQGHANGIIVEKARRILYDNWEPEEEDQ